MSYARVYLLSGLIAHLLPADSDSADPLSLTLCGRSTYPGVWRGTRDYGERQQAADMPLCATCALKMVDETT